MAAIPVKERILSVVLFGIIIGIMTQEAQITALIGEYGAAATIIVAVAFVALREVVKEFGLEKGDLIAEKELIELEEEE